MSRLKELDQRPLRRNPLFWVAAVVGAAVIVFALVFADVAYATPTPTPTPSVTEVPYPDCEPGEEAVPSPDGYVCGPADEAVPDAPEEVPEELPEPLPLDPERPEVLAETGVADVIVGWVVLGVLTLLLGSAIVAIIGTVRRS